MTWNGYHRHTQPYHLSLCKEIWQSKGWSWYVEATHRYWRVGRLESDSGSSPLLPDCVGGLELPGIIHWWREHELKRQLVLIQVGCWASTMNKNNAALEHSREVSPCPYCLAGWLQCPLLTKLNIQPAGKGEMLHSLTSVSQSRAKKCGCRAERQSGNTKAEAARLSTSFWIFYNSDRFNWKYFNQV